MKDSTLRSNVRELFKERIKYTCLRAFPRWLVYILIDNDQSDFNNFSINATITDSKHQVKASLVEYSRKVKDSHLDISQELRGNSC